MSMNFVYRVKNSVIDARLVDDEDYEEYLKKGWSDSPAGAHKKVVGARDDKIKEAETAKPAKAKTEETKKEKSESSKRDVLRRTSKKK